MFTNDHIFVFLWLGTFQTFPFHKITGVIKPSFVNVHVPVPLQCQFCHLSRVHLLTFQNLFSDDFISCVGLPF